MTTPRLADRDAGQVDALIADRYLDDLLAAAERRADDVPADAALDPEVRHAVRVLRSALVRVHPSFRFEERLATTLAGLAAEQAGTALAADGGGQGLPFRAAAADGGGQGLPFHAAAADGGTRVLPFRAPAGLGRAARTGLAADPLLEAVLAGELDPADAEAVDRATVAPAARRPLLVGGVITTTAITTTAISLVGVAWVAWRASRPASRSGAGLMGRAARTAHARRARTAALVGVGLGGPA